LEIWSKFSKFWKSLKNSKKDQKIAKTPKNINIKPLPGGVWPPLPPAADAHIAASLALTFSIYRGIQQ